METFQRFIDLRCSDNDPELFALALAIRHIREPIDYGGSDIGRPGNDSALDPHHLIAFITRAVEMTWKNNRFAQEWSRTQQVFPQVKEAGERGQTLFQKALDRAKNDQKVMKYFPMIDFAMDYYTYVFASRVYQKILRSVIERLMGICWHVEVTSLRIKLERSPQTWTCD